VVASISVDAYTAAGFAEYGTDIRHRKDRLELSADIRVMFTLLVVKFIVFAMESVNISSVVLVCIFFPNSPSTTYSTTSYNFNFFFFGGGLQNYYQICNER
jgi:hypothetical protein